LSSQSESILLSVTALTDEIAVLFADAGLSSAGAQRIARALIEAEQQGLKSHGLMHAPVYLERMRKGSVSTHDRAETVSDHGAVAVLDARHMLGHLAAEQAMALAIEKAGRFGIGAVAVRHGFHFGAAGRYVAQAAQAGMVGIAMSNTRPLMPAPGGAEAVVGNNPIAIAIPTADEPMVVVDVAMSEGALGRIRHHHQRGEPIPGNWAVTAEGLPTTSAAEAIKGLLLPTGGPKGFALAMAIDMACGLLSGGAVGSEINALYGDTSKPNDCAFLFLALNPQAFGADDLPQRAQAQREHIRQARRAPDTTAIRTPGEMKWRTAATQQETVRIDRNTLSALRACAAPVDTLAVSHGGERP